MTRGLLVVDVQNDFCEGGSLAVTGGAAVAAAITEHIRAHRGDYAAVVASRDWHRAGESNGGHFAPEGDWPPHCVMGTPGADYHPWFDATLATAHVVKGMGVPAYSMFDGVVGEDGGAELTQVLRDLGVTDVDVVGIATDYCVLRTALDAAGNRFRTRVLADLTAAVAPDTRQAALRELAASGIEVG